MIPRDLLRRAAKPDPGRPLVTFYDGATGERVELSVTTFGNWVAKTANLLRDELDAGPGPGPGPGVAVLLPLHWQAAVWLMACWECGAVPVLGGEASGADVVVTGPDDLERAVAAAASETVALSLAPLAGRFPGPLPPGVLDYGAEVLSQPDVFVTEPVSESAIAVALPDGPLDGAALAAESDRAAARWGLHRGERVLTTEALDTREGLLAGLLAPVAGGASIVMCRNLQPEKADQRVAEEKITSVYSKRSILPDLRRLGRA